MNLECGVSNIHVNQVKASKICALDVWAQSINGSAFTTDQIRSENGETVANCSPDNFNVIVHSTAEVLIATEQGVDMPIAATVRGMPIVTTAFCLYNCDPILADSTAEQEITGFIRGSQTIPAFSPGSVWKLELSGNFKSSLDFGQTAQILIKLNGVIAGGTIPFPCGVSNIPLQMCCTFSINDALFIPNLDGITVLNLDTTSDTTLSGVSDGTLYTNQQHLQIFMLFTTIESSPPVGAFRPFSVVFYRLI